MLYILIILFLAYSLFKIFLEICELKFVKEEVKKEAVILDEKTYKEAGNITIFNKKFAIFTLIYEFFITICWLSFGLRLLYQNVVLNNTIFENLVFVISFFLIGGILSLPIDIYSKFVKDKKFGFSNLSIKTFLLDLLKSFLLSIIFGSIVVYLLLICINFLGNFWWFWAAILSFIIVLIINFLYPTLIAPLFNKMEILKDDVLKDSIEALLKKCGFKSSGVFTIDASKRDNRLNAYFGGFGSSKRVVLFDTLIKKLTKNEILAVLGHELGHFKNKDILRILVFSAILFFIIFGLLGNLPETIFNAVGIEKSGGSIIVMIAILSNLLSFIITPLQSFLSRKREFAADKFGAKMQNKNDMINALKKLGSENKAFPKSHKLYSNFYHSHPTLYERICELNDENI
ncbi:M48 family metallopeptidase [Campylobacter ureolyticus]|uniref:M48 family metallopeptidase n=1 Tax=Campylobacter ureolyticus TaxID=827 RepID=UPI0022B2F8C0|nr:M48 family metallopeptidase [Campylobacter ureolyticus]MCZ6110685.1 M48 family metallopeptidase [Campylobacter ureolyticus]MDK8322990.1 M48 family metallopeptidase [Campylobacter ureolyticus]